MKTWKKKILAVIAALALLLPVPHPAAASATTAGDVPWESLVTFELPDDGSMPWEPVRLFEHVTRTHADGTVSEFVQSWPVQATHDGNGHILVSDWFYFQQETYDVVVVTKTHMSPLLHLTPDDSNQTVSVDVSQNVPLDVQLPTQQATDNAVVQVGMGNSNGQPTVIASAHNHVLVPPGTYPVNVTSKDDTYYFDELFPDQAINADAHALQVKSGDLKPYVVNTASNTGTSQMGVDYVALLTPNQTVTTIPTYGLSINHETGPFTMLISKNFSQMLFAYSFGYGWVVRYQAAADNSSHTTPLIFDTKLNASLTFPHSMKFQAGEGNLNDYLKLTDSKGHRVFELSNPYVGGQQLATITYRSGSRNILSTTLYNDFLTAPEMPLKTGTYTATYQFQVPAPLQISPVVGTFSVVNDDHVPPEPPVARDLHDDDTALFGKAEPGSTITISAHGQTFSDRADSNGSFVVNLDAQPGNSKLVVTATDDAGNVSAPTYVTVKEWGPPAQAIFDDFTEYSTVLSGRTEAGAALVLTTEDGQHVLGRGNASATNGSFQFRVPKQKAGTVLNLTATDKAGNSNAFGVTSRDVTPPSLPQVDPVTDKDTRVTGTAEPDSTVYVNSDQDVNQHFAVADANGHFSVDDNEIAGKSLLHVIAVDRNSNASQPRTVHVIDTTPPSGPTVNPVTDKDTHITGTTEPQARVATVINNLHYVSQPADAKGHFTLTIPKQHAGTTLTLTAKDAAGNASAPVTVNVQDGTPPLVHVNTVHSANTVVTGSSEAGAIITVKIGTTTLTATADSHGAFSVPINPQAIGTKISVTAADTAGNASAAVIVSVVK